MRKLLLLVFLSALLISTQAQSKKEFSNIFQNTNLQATSSAETSLKTIRLIVKDEVYSDETVIVFQEGYNASYQTSDGDAPYMAGAAISISSLTSDNKNMAINFMPELNEVKEVKLNVNAKTSRNAELCIIDLPGENYQYILKDKYLNIEKVLEKSDNYKFIIDKSVKNSFGTERFLLAIKPLNKPQTEVNQETSGKINLTFFPNPASNTLFIKQDELSSKLIETSIYTMSGELIKKNKVDIENPSMDVSELLSGTYIIIVNDSRTGERIVKSKFLKQ